MSNLCQSRIEKLLVFLEHIATLTDNQISTQNKTNDDQNEAKKFAFHQMERIIFHFSFGLHDFFHFYLVAQGPMRIKMSLKSEKISQCTRKVSQMAFGRRHTAAILSRPRFAVVFKTTQLRMNVSSSKNGGNKFVAWTSMLKSFGHPEEAEMDEYECNL